MRLIKIEPTKSGGHFAQTIDHISKIPDGWAVVPDDMETPNFPYGAVVVEEIYGIPTVTSWAPGEIPEPLPSQEGEPSTDEVLNALLGVSE